jgi:hypothetical protein
MKDVAMPELKEGHRYLLEWLSKEDFSQYGECKGAALDRLIELGLAQVHKPDIGQSGFIVRGHALDYCAVSLTDAGRAALTGREADPT